MIAITVRFVEFNFFGRGLKNNFLKFLLRSVPLRLSCNVYIFHRRHHKHIYGSNTYKARKTNSRLKQLTPQQQQHWWHDRYMCSAAASPAPPGTRRLRWRGSTCNSLIDTQQLGGKPCSIGTRNWRQPDQWPTSSIMQIRLNIRMNTLAMLRNWNNKVGYRDAVWVGWPLARWWPPSSRGENPAAWERGTGGSPTSDPPAASCRLGWRSAWILQ